MELLLGLLPMSQFDASARPMGASFTPNPDFAPYLHRPARIDILERNPDGALGQAESDAMDFSHEDAISEEVMNAIVWGSVKGAGVPVPPPVRGAFVQTLPEPEDAD
jgi:hypothetical protein